MQTTPKVQQQCNKIFALLLEFSLLKCYHYHEDFDRKVNRMKKRLIAILTVTVAAILLTVGICAAEITVDRTTSLTAAISALGGKGGTIVIAEDTLVTADITIPEQSGDLTHSLGKYKDCQQHKQQCFFFRYACKDKR